MKSASPFLHLNKSLEEPLNILTNFTVPLKGAVFCRMIIDLVHTQTCSCSPPVWLCPHRLEDAAVP